MSLNTIIPHDHVKSYYNGLVKKYQKNVYFFATPTNETYRVNNGYNNWYQQEYAYKFCHSLHPITLNSHSYNGREVYCHYFKNDGLVEMKPLNNGYIANFEKVYTNVKVDSGFSVPLTIENYGEVYSSVQAIAFFILIAIVGGYFFFKSLIPKLR